MRRAIALALLLLVPMPSLAQSEPLAIDIQAIDFEYGPEDWKGGDVQRIDDEATLRRETTPWGKSLGLAVTIRMRINMSDPDGVTFKAMLSDGATVTEGIVTGDASALTARFDVDGQRAFLDRAETLPLRPGTWTLRLSASEDTLLSSAPRGTGTARFDTGAIEPIAIWRPSTLQPIEGMAIPESLLPGMDEVGPGSDTWFPAEPLPSTTRIVIAADAGKPGKTVRFVAYEPITVGPLTSWEARLTGEGVSGRDGRIEATFGLENVTGIRVLAAYGDGGGVATWILAFGDERPAIDAFSAPAPGSEGGISVGILAPGLDDGRPGGAVHSLSEGGPRASTLLASGRLLPDGEGHWRGDLDARETRRAGISQYALLAVLDDDGSYVSHASMRRGVDIDLYAPRLGVGVTSTLRADLQNIALDGRAGIAHHLSIAGALRSTFAGDLLRADQFEVPEAGALSKTWSVAPEAAGATEWVVTVDTGDLHHEQRLVTTVLTAEAYEDATRKWYDPERVTPGPPLALLLLAALLSARRKR